MALFKTKADPSANQKPDAPATRQPNPSMKWLVPLIVIAFFLFVGYSRFAPQRNVTKITYSTFLTEAAQGKVKSADINNSNGSITGTLTNGSNYSTQGSASPTNADGKALQKEIPTITFSSTPPSILGLLLPYILLTVVFVVVFALISRQARGQMNGIMSIGRSKAKVFNQEKPSTTFKDVAGYNGVKQEISEVVDFLKNPARYSAIGAKIPKGVLLVGPPGTGKTLLARAVAGEAGVPFLSVSGSDFMEMFVGVGASRVRDLFQNARKEAPAIIFIDEIDSIGRKRGAGLGGGHDEREQTLNQMLSEMDGFDPTEGVVLIGATNRPDILDPALMRPGRFDRQIVVPLPDLDERLPILKVHCDNKKIGADVDLETVARGTPGMSGADLANLVNEAALHAVRRDSEIIAMADFESARDRVLMGQRREATVLSVKERERVAFHESGHALLAYVLEGADPVHKVTIIPSGMALGVTMMLPMEERHIYPKHFIEDSLCVRMGGRVAELLIYGDLSTGAADDLQGNTELARRMVREWGMSAEVGPMAWGSQGQVFLGEDLMHTRDYSEDMGRIIDDEVAKILRAQEERAIEILTKHRSGLDALAATLLEHETVDGATVTKIIDEANGEPVHPASERQDVPRFSSLATVAGPVEFDNAPSQEWPPPTWPPPSPTS